MSMMQQLDRLRMQQAAGAPVLWDFDQLSPAGWYDETTFVESNGFASEWQDKSVNSNHITQTTTSFRGTISAGELVLPSGKYMESPTGVLPTGSGGRHLFIVGKITSLDTSSAGYFLCQKNNTWSSLRGMRISSEPAIRWNGASFYSGPAIPLSNTVIIVVSYASASAAGSTRHFINGTERAYSGGSGDSSALISDRTDFVIGADYALGLVNSIGANYKRLVVLNSATLSTADIQRGEGKLAHDLGLTSLLPSDHPYKTNPPTV